MIVKDLVDALDVAISELDSLPITKMSDRMHEEVDVIVWRLKSLRSKYEPDLRAVDTQKLESWKRTIEP